MSSNITYVNHVRRERLRRLSHIVGCRLDTDGYSLLSKRGLVVSYDGKNYWPTELGIERALLDEYRFPYR